MKSKGNKKKKIMIIAVVTLGLVVVFMLIRNYSRARAAEKALNSEEVQQAQTFMREFNDASAAKKAEILNQTMSNDMAKQQAEAFWALAKGGTNKKKEQLISAWVLAIPTSADFSAIAKQYRENGMGRGGRSLPEQILYELKPAKTYQAALSHLSKLGSNQL